MKSTVDDFLVQARAVPLPGAIPVAVNQAIATRLGGHRVTVALENGVVVARVDGVVDNTGGVTNVGSGTLQRLGTTPARASCSSGRTARPYGWTRWVWSA